jgi:bla regulator protein blaR1
MIIQLLIALGNHLWQSTVVASLIAAVALALRSAPAGARCWLWLAALLKFALPISMLIFLGSALAPVHVTESALEPAAFYSVNSISQPLTYTPQTLPSAVKKKLIAPPKSGESIAIGIAAIWAAGFAAVFVSWFADRRRISLVRNRATLQTGGWELEVLSRVRLRAQLESEIALLLTEERLEPGVAGNFRPALLWPRSLSATLSEEEMESIMAHEVEHVRRRDNLIAAIATAVAGFFWFHPLAWWLRARLMNERERACDEAALNMGSKPETYAAGILRTCQFCVAAPAGCVSGITGSELKSRVRRIVSGKIVRALPRGLKWMLAGLGAVILAGPVAFGVLDAPRVSAALLQDADANSRLGFEVAAIKPTDPGKGEQESLMIGQGMLTVTNLSLKSLIKFAYDAKSDSQISGYPDWVTSTRYDITAKEDDATAAALQKMTRDERPQQVRLLVQSLLVDRFQLKVSRATKEIPVYALVIAKGGPHLEEVADPSAGSKPRGSGFNMNKRGEIHALNATLEMFASGVLSDMPEADGRVVVNKTGLAGRYNFTLKWTPETGTNPNGPGDSATLPVQADSPAPGLFTALEEELGLKLESQKGSVETLVVDHVEQPSAN